MNVLFAWPEPCIIHSVEGHTKGRAPVRDTPQSRDVKAAENPADDE
jgi:hypothetical protein